MTTATQPRLQRRDKAQEPVIVFDHVTIGFDGKPVLDDISFRVHRGENRIIIGPAGVGKSVLLKLTNGLLKPDSGTISLFGRDIVKMKQRDLFDLRADVGTVFQEGALFDSLTVRDNVGYRLAEEHVPEDEIDRRVDEALRFVELEHTMDKFPSELSGGMRRRVAIARAIVTEPQLLLYDSPTGGLDPITSTTIIELIIKQRDAYHTTSLLVTHRLQDAFMLATHRYSEACKCTEPLPQGQTEPNTAFLVLNEGHIVFDGPTIDLVRSDDPFIREYLK
jgi:phospholipid/cholesterol/gamma-HCH transport system ATP-binding protein